MYNCQCVALGYCGYTGYISYAYCYFVFILLTFLRLVNGYTTLPKRLLLLFLLPVVVSNFIFLQFFSGVRYLLYNIKS